MLLSAVHSISDRERLARLIILNNPNPRSVHFAMAKLMVSLHPEYF
jgi:uncharacterized alpha-E superfamily protein